MPESISVTKNISPESLDVQGVKLPFKQAVVASVYYNPIMKSMIITHHNVTEQGAADLLRIGAQHMEAQADG